MAWFDMLKRTISPSASQQSPRHFERLTQDAAFNTRVPAERYEASMNNRSSVRVSDGSGDYYVTLTMYHDLHCLVSHRYRARTRRAFLIMILLQMRFRWFLDPKYYANKTWEEQANDAGLMGHYSRPPPPLYHADPSYQLTPRTQDIVFRASSSQSCATVTHPSERFTGIQRDPLPNLIRQRRESA